MDSKGIYIAAVASALGSDTVDNIKQAAAFEKDEQFVVSRIGARTLPHRSDTETACSLGIKAARLAMSKAGLVAGDIQLLIFVTQNPDHGGLPHNSAIVHGKLGLKTSAICFDVGLGCSGLVYAMEIARALMEASSLEHSIIITSDQYRPHLKQNAVNTNLIFGDAAAATILSQSGKLKLEHISLGTDGAKHKMLARGPDGIEMNGRGVFGFAQSTVPTQIQKMCETHDVDLQEIDLFLLHQGSKAIIEEISKKLDLPSERIPCDIQHCGNTVSSSIALLLEKHIDDPTKKSMVLCGFGVGLSWGTALLKRID